MAKTIPNLLLPSEMATLLAGRIKTLRLLEGYKRVTLARQCGVTSASLKRFETTGRISLGNLLRLAHALGRLEQFAGLFEPPEATTLAELESQSEKPVPKRGRI